MGSTKTEPVSRGVPPAFTADIGIKKGNHAESGTVHVTKVPMYEGRGLAAPMPKCTTYKKGSQS